jgi:hypothetical protein
MNTRNSMQRRYVSPFVLVAMLAACGGGEDDSGISLPDAPTQGSQSAMFDWTIRQSGSPTTCAAVRATEIHVTATPENGLPVTHTFQCILTPGTLGLPAGRYAVSAELYDGGGPQRLASSPPQALTVPATGTVPTVHLAFSL